MPRSLASRTSWVATIRITARCSPTRSPWTARDDKIRLKLGPRAGGLRCRRGGGPGARQPHPRRDGAVAVRRPATGRRRAADWRHCRMAAIKTIGILSRDVLDHSRREIRWQRDLDAACDLVCRLLLEKKNTPLRP